MLTARRFCQINNYKPKFYIEYTTGSAATAIMPYMAVTAEAALLDKIKFTGGTLTQNLDEADVILYVHCGSAEEPANEKMAHKLQTLLNSGKHVAVIDASENYESSQMLLPVLLANNVTINKLVSYSAWNTFGNAAGTAAAQSAIFTGSLNACQNICCLRFTHTTLTLQLPACWMITAIKNFCTTASAQYLPCAGRTL